ncbi:MAG: prolipoprotein diacylglyceryl transferase [Anaerolineae bacterium]|nr:prolipoprotein diacylglyceryl transferase [Anaerolineae bacterium]
MYPLLCIGPLTVASYSVLLGVGLLGGAALAYWIARCRRLNAAHAMDAALSAAIGGMIGARALYVFVNWAYYGDHLGQAFDLWGGGHFWHGGLVGGLAAVLIYAAARRVSPWPLLDALAPGAAFFAICAWLGCLLDKCAYGVETYPGLGFLWALSLELPDIYGVWTPRVAVQLMGAIWGTIVLVVTILAGRNPRFEGFVFPLWLTLYCAGSFGLVFLRVDVVPMAPGWRLIQAADLALFATGAMLLVMMVLRNRRRRGD